MSLSHNPQRQAGWGEGAAGARGVDRVLHSPVVAQWSNKEGGGILQPQRGAWLAFPNSHVFLNPSSSFTIPSAAAVAQTQEFTVSFQSSEEGFPEMAHPTPSSFICREGKEGPQGQRLVQGHMGSQGRVGLEPRFLHSSV